MVAEEFHSGAMHRLWRDQLGPFPPFRIDEKSLIVAYNTIAEFSCFHVLGWSQPKRILDLYIEFRNLTNGFEMPGLPENPKVKYSLVCTLLHFGLHTIGYHEKRSMIDLILRGGSYTSEEQKLILDYCTSDVQALKALLPEIARKINPGRDTGCSLLHGRSMWAFSRVEHNGIPVDRERLGKIENNWSLIQDSLIGKFDRFGIYRNRSFSEERFLEVMIRFGIDWPLCSSGRPILRKDVFKDMAKSYPDLLEPLRQLRKTMAQTRLKDFCVGSDGRNRFSTRPFVTKTGRCAPSNKKNLLGAAKWLRYVIQPEPDHSLISMDWVSQELCILAVLSGDPELLKVCQSADAHLACAKRMKMAPEWATKDTHPKERNLLKVLNFAVVFGCGAFGLATSLKIDLFEAEALLAKHKKIFPVFWKWAQGRVDEGFLTGRMETVFGWNQFVPPLLDQAKITKQARVLKNFSAQANGGEMLRLAISLGIERGLEICSTMHDAVMIHVSNDCRNAEIEKMAACMAEASRVVLDGFEIQVDPKEIIHPNHYEDPDGQEMWDTVYGIIE
jgi:hypothetical protein